MTRRIAKERLEASNIATVSPPATDLQVKQLLSVRVPASQMNKKVLVIGAGISGLTAAYVLKKNGLSVRVMESSPYVGGRMSSFNLEGHIVDRAAQFFPRDFYRTLVPLISELGLESATTEISTIAGVVRDNTVRTIEATNLFSVLSGGLMKWWELTPKSLLGLPDLLRARQLSMSDVSQWPALDRVTADSWARRYLGDIGTKCLAEPLVSGLSFQKLENASQSLLLWILLFFLKANQLRTFRAGMGALPEVLATQLDVELNSAVLSVVEKNDKVEVRSTSGIQLVDYVVLATPAPVSRQILNEQERTKFEQMVLNCTYRKVLNIAVVTNRNWRAQAPYKKMTFLVIPRSERGMISSLTQDFRMSETPSGEMFQIFCSPEDKNAEMMNWSGKRILKRITAQMESFYPGFQSSLKAMHVTRIQNGVPDHIVGKSSMVKNYYDEASTLKRRVVLAGDYLGFYGTDGAAFTGLKAADFLLRAR
jgi:oxygen-dependent protoporphyrinogen oxidase